MKCDICGKRGAFNFYPVVVMLRETIVGDARWGNGGQDRAREQGAEFARWRKAADPAEFLFEIRVIAAHNRGEVVRAYEIKREGP